MKNKGNRHIKTIAQGLSAVFGTFLITGVFFLSLLGMMGIPTQRILSSSLSTGETTSFISPIFLFNENDVDNNEYSITNFNQFEPNKEQPDPLRDVYLHPGVISYSLLYNEGDEISPKAFDQTKEMAYRGIRCNPTRSYTWAGGKKDFSIFYENPNLLTDLIEWTIYDYPILSVYRTGNDDVSVLVDSLGHFMIKSSVSLEGGNLTGLYEQIETHASSILDASLSESNQTQDGLMYAVYKNICENAHYSDDVNDTIHANDIYGALVEGESKCYGLSCAYKYILDKQNIPNFIAYGTGNGIPHAWNIVWYENQWLACDLTAGCEVLESAGATSSEDVANFIFYQACLVPQEEYFANCNVVMEQRCYDLENAYVASISQ